MDDSTEEEGSSASMQTISNAHVVILRTNLSNEEIDKIFLDIAMALRSAGHVVSFLCCHVNAEVSEHLRDYDITRVFRWMPSSLFGFFKTPLRLLSSALLIIWLKMFRNYMFPSFVITDSFVVLPILRQIGVNVVHFYQFEEICRRNNIFRRIMVPCERWFLNHANKMLIENRISLGRIQRIYSIPFPTEVFYLTAAYKFLEQDIDKEKIVISRLPPNVHYFLILGIYGPKLNCRTLIPAFEMLMDSVSSRPCNRRKIIYLVISGYVVDKNSQKFYTKLQNYVHQLRHAPQILFFKNMGMLLQKYLIAHCSAVLLGDPDLTSCSPILECLSVGAIIISARSDYAVELITDQITGFVIDPTPENYHERMLKVLEDDIFVGYMKYMIVLDYFNRFSFSALEQQLQKIVENMANIFNEGQTYRYLSTEAYKRYLVDTLQLLRSRQIFEREGPMTGNQLKELLFQMQVRIIQTNTLEGLPPNQDQANDERTSSEEEALIIDLDRQADEENPMALSSISNIIAAVQLRNLEDEPQPGPSGISGEQSRFNRWNQKDLARVNPRLNIIQEEPQPGPSGLSTRSNILNQNPVSDSSTEESQSALTSLSNMLPARQVEIPGFGRENVSPQTTLIGKLQIEQQLSGLYDQFITPNEIQPQEIPQVADVVQKSPPLSDNPVPIPIVDKGKRKMGTKIGEGGKKTSNPQVKSDTKDIKSAQDKKTLKPNTTRKFPAPTEKKIKPQTQSESNVYKKAPSALNKDRSKLTKTKALPEKQQPITSRKADLSTSSISSIPKMTGGPVTSKNVKTPKAVTHGTAVVKPSVSRDKTKPSEQAASKSSCLPPTGVKMVSSIPSKSPPAPQHGTRLQAGSANIKKKRAEKIFSSSAPVGGVIVTTSRFKLKSKESSAIPVESPVIKTGVPTPSSNYTRKPVDKKLPKNPPGKIAEVNIKLGTTSPKTAITRKPTRTGNVLPTTSKSTKKQIEDATAKSIPEIELRLHLESPETPVIEEVAQPNDERTQEIMSLALDFKKSTTSTMSSVSDEKRTVKRHQTPYSESDTKRQKLESKSLPDLRNLILESHFPLNFRRSEPIDIDNEPLTRAPPPARITGRKVYKACLRHSPRIKLVPVTNAKLDTSTLRSSTLTQIISPRRLRRSIGTFLPLNARSLASKGNTSPRLLVKGRSILTVPKPPKSRSPRSAAYKLEQTSSEEQTKDLRRPLRKTPAATDLRICRLRRRCRFCTFRYVAVQRLPTGELPITTVFPPSGVESESSIEGMEPRGLPIGEGFSPRTRELTPREENTDEDAFEKH